MKVEAHILNWNELDIIRLTIKHYKQFCSRIVIYDNYSDDGSDIVAQQMGCEVKKFGIPGELNDGHYLEIKNNCWKGSDADWVIVCDCDEIVGGSDILSRLETASNEGATIMRMHGYSMYSEVMPKGSFFEVKTGIMDESYAKLAVFSPKIKGINYVYGCHVANPEGKITYSIDPISLYHYKYIGGIDRVLARHRKYKTRLSQLNIRWKMGHVYSKPEQEQRESFEQNLRSSKTLF